MRLALFDFDGTLTRHDTLFPFLRYLVGTPRFALGLAATAPVLGAYALKLMRNDLAKQRVLRHFLQGRDAEGLAEAGTRFAQDCIPSLLQPAQMTLLQAHQARGDTCVLVSASLDVYLRPWSQAQGFDALLCSSLAVDGGRVTGLLHGANCHGPEKVRRIEAWLAGRQPEHITAYGDSAGDREMLALADEPIWVR